MRQKRARSPSAYGAMNTITFHVDEPLLPSRLSSLSSGGILNALLCTISLGCLDLFIILAAVRLPFTHIELKSTDAKCSGRAKLNKVLQKARGTYRSLTCRFRVISAGKSKKGMTSAGYWKCHENLPAGKLKVDTR